MQDSKKKETKNNFVIYLEINTFKHAHTYEIEFDLAKYVELLRRKRGIKYAQGMERIIIMSNCVL